MDSFYAPVITVAGAVMVGYLTNFTAEHYRRFSDGSAIAAAICGELSSHTVALPDLREMLKGWIVAIQAGETLTLRPWEPPNDPVFDELVGKIGLLGIDLVEDAVFTYQQIRAFRAGLRTIHDSTGMHPKEMEVRFVRCLVVLERAEQRGLPLITRLRERSRQVYWVRLTNWHTVIRSKVLAFSNSSKPDQVN